VHCAGRILKSPTALKSADNFFVQGLPAIQNLSCDLAFRAVVRRINAEPAVRIVACNAYFWRIENEAH
jgi:hypothetical protein